MKQKKVMQFLKPLGLKVTLADSRDLFLGRLKGVASPEKKTQNHRPHFHPCL